MQDIDKIPDEVLNMGRMIENVDKIEKITFNDLLTQIGGFGRWNWMLLGFSYISCLLAATSHLSIIYLAYSPHFGIQTNKDGQQFDNKCQAGGDHDQGGVDHDQGGGDHDQGIYMYDSSVFKNTVVTEWDLVCERGAMLPTLTFSYMLGICVAIIIAGALADTFGRRVVVLVMVTTHIISSLLTWLSRSVWMFLVCRMFVGGSIHTAWASLFILLQEITPSQHTTITSGVMVFGWSTGSMLISVLAYFIRDWRTLQLVFFCMSLSMLSYIVVIPESPLWLLSSGRVEDAKKILHKIARNNGKNIEPQLLDKTVEQLQNNIHGNLKRSFVDELKNMRSLFAALVRTPKMRMRTLLLVPTFFAVGMGSYGIHFSSRFANLDIFAVNIIKASTNFLVVVLFMYILHHVDRTKCLLTLYIMTGVVAVSFYLCPTIIRPVVFILAQTLYAGDYYVLDTYVPEILPTHTRNFGFNMLEFVSKIGSALSPFIVDLGGVVEPGIPPLVFGCVLLVSSVSFLFLPETRGKQLPQTITQVEEEQEVTIARKFFAKSST